MLRRCITVLCQAEAVLCSSLSQQREPKNTKLEENVESEKRNTSSHREIDKGNFVTDAQLLHSHCTRVIQTLGPSTPPEAFVFRGNAYLALGRPYFALADYATASSVLQFSHEQHQAKCLRAVQHFPLTQSAIFPATDTHVHIHVEPWLVHGVNVETHTDTSTITENNAKQTSTNNNEEEQQIIVDNYGSVSKVSSVNNKEDVNDLVVMEPMSRGVYYKPHLGHHHNECYNHQSVNNADNKSRLENNNCILQKGSAITLPVTPWIRYPLRDNHCAYCACPLEDRVFPCNVDDHHKIADDEERKNNNNSHKSRKRTHGCHEEYCSRECRARALSTYHAVVCRNELYQALELDLFDKAISWEPPETKKTNNSGGGGGVVTESNDQEKKISENVNEFYQVRRNPYYYQLLLLRIMAMATQQHLTATTLAEIRLLTGKLTFHPVELCEDMLHFYLRLARALRIQTTSCYEEFISILSRIHANSLFTDTDIELVLP